MASVQVINLSLHEMQIITTEHCVPFWQETHGYEESFK
jgi:hypothetical protein